jgi:uncharacterized protein YndB with AHSA1/START domain
MVYRALLDAPAVATWMVPTGMTSHVHAFDAREGGSFRISLTYDAPMGTGKTTARENNSALEVGADLRRPGELRARTHTKVCARTSARPLTIPRDGRAAGHTSGDSSRRTR